jgi:DNA polymerase-1
VTLAEATEFIDKYFAGYPGISTYINDSIKLARDHGYCETITGRRRPLPELSYSGGRAAASAENIAVNTPIQGSAADLIKLAMIKIENRFRQIGLKSKMILQVHDELLFECPKEEIDEAVDIIKDSMEHAMTLKVPLDVQIGIGSNWLEAH